MNETMLLESGSVHEHGEKMHPGVASVELFIWFVCKDRIVAALRSTALSR